jgi:rare lipoprotein A
MPGSVSGTICPQFPCLPVCAWPTCLSLASLIAGCATAPEQPMRSPQPAAYLGEKSGYAWAPAVQLRSYQKDVVPVAYRERGLASWYGAGSGTHTASGARFNHKGFSAAHRTLPLHSKVRVTNLENGRSVSVVVNDRGPFHKRRVIDVSEGAAKALKMRGVARVEVEALDKNVRPVAAKTKVHKAHKGHKQHWRKPTGHAKRVH